MDEEATTADPVTAVNGVAVNDFTGSDATVLAAVALVVLGVSKLLGSALGHGARSVAARVRRRRA